MIETVELNVIPKELNPLVRACRNLEIPVVCGGYAKGTQHSGTGLFSVHTAQNTDDFQCYVQFGESIKDLRTALKKLGLDKQKAEHMGSIITSADGSWQLIKYKGRVTLHLARKYHVGLTVYFLQYSMSEMKKRMAS